MEVLDEGLERSLERAAALCDELAPALPGREDGVGGERDQER